MEMFELARVMTPRRLLSVTRDGMTRARPRSPDLPAAVLYIRDPADAAQTGFTSTGTFFLRYLLLLLWARSKQRTIRFRSSGKALSVRLSQTCPACRLLSLPFLSPSPLPLHPQRLVCGEVK